MKSAQNIAVTWGGMIGGVLCVLGLASPGCTRESVRVALETQRRADEVQQATFDRQHESLRILLFRDLARRLEPDGKTLTPAQWAALNEAWNDRDLIEFWLVQQERAKALRLLGVDAKLYGDQSILDLLVKALEAKFDRGKEGLAAYAGARLNAPPELPAEQKTEERP